MPPPHELWRNAAMWVTGVVLVYSIMFATGALIFHQTQKLQTFGVTLVLSAIALAWLLASDRKF